jgi:hypothetical protein
VSIFVLALVGMGTSAPPITVVVEIPAPACNPLVDTADRVLVGALLVFAYPEPSCCSSCSSPVLMLGLEPASDVLLDGVGLGTELRLGLV